MSDFSSIVNNADVYYREAFQRNIGLISKEEQDKLRRCRVAIAGVGGVGGFHLINLVRMGVGKFTIADMDSYEPPNIQRQCGAFVNTLGKNKAETMAEMALSINPYLDIKVFSESVSEDNINGFLSEADIFLDGIDFFSIEARRVIFRKVQEKGIYAVTAGPLGFGSAMLIFSPKGMGFDEYFDINDSMPYLEKIVAFGVGLAPAALHLSYLNLDSVDLKSKKGPSLVSACNLCSAIATTEVLNILLERKKSLSVPHYFQFDPYGKKMKAGYLTWGNRHPFQRIKRWYLLRKFSR
ncbi:MAG: hypothetical protein B1H08_01815 [Candidatus Omnitrophica bacterium 4484_171]|nr:MAG: hypothetical protein B1H08_01815 [Candidatus Omnitrophica bacterium 4484_171]